MITRTCKNCKTEFQIYQSQIEDGKRRGREYGIFCSLKCRSSGKFHPGYNGGLEKIDKTCQHCKKVFEATVADTRYRPVKYCSRKCTYDSKRISKGYFINTRGYKELYLPDHPKANTVYYPEHRYVMEQHIGRVLNEDEIVHHINRNKRDNRIENLVIMTAEEHSQEHINDRKKAGAEYWTLERRKAFGDKIRKYRKERFWSSNINKERTK